ncbi:MAG: CHAT domain-containing tetratricopeptide repeat protein [Burkholderiaceae bacterium]
MSVSSAKPSAPELARRMVDIGEPAPAGLNGEDWRSLAWTLKDLCYSAWSSEPQRAARAADALRGLCRIQTGRGPGPPGFAAGAVGHPLAAEIEALARWTAGIAQLTRGEMHAATQSFDEAARLFAQLGQVQHATQTQVPKIMALAMLGQHEQAIACATRTHEELIAQGDVAAASKVSLNLGSLHLGRDAYASAAKHYRDAAVLFARVVDHEHSVMADIGLADTLTAMGDFDEALLIYARARMRAATHGFPVLEALVDESCALLQLARGAYREALAGFERSRRGYESMAMPQHQAIAEKQLADAYLELRLLPEALALYEQAVARFEALDEPDELAWTLAQQGRTQVLLERPQSASESLQRASGLFRAQGAAVGEAAVALTRSELALTNGQIAEALSLADTAAQVFGRAGLAERQARADVLRAHALLGLHRGVEATAMFDAGLNHARTLGLLSIQVNCLSGRGCAALASGNIEGGRADFLAAIELFEEQRRVLPGDEFQRAFLTGHLRPYQELLRLALQDDERSGAAAHALAVLEWLERYRARALGERVAQVDSAGEDDAVQAQRTRLNWLYRRVQRAQDEAAPVAGLVDEVRRTEFELLERARRTRLAGPESTPGAAGAETFDPRALQQLLRDDEALVEYGVLDGELFAVLLTRANIQVRRRLANWPEVTEAVRSARFQIESLRSGQAPLVRHLSTLTERANQRLQRVHELVWAPLAPLMSQVRRALIVPHGPLGTLPFGALVDALGADRACIDLAVVPSARVALHGLRCRPRAARSALVFGESSRLEHARAEAEFVARMFPSARLCVDAQATLQSLHAHAAQADVIHLACHAQFRADNPMFSALHLHDGALTVQAAQSLKLQRCTVVLSACETALADRGSGDEMVGLVRAFLLAGAARVVASLWPVDDRVTAKFMAHFYAALASERSPAASLRAAQIAVRREHPHPCHWAAFTLFGGW